jgi:hypothetical protein
MSTLHEDLCTLTITSLLIVLRMRNTSEKCVQKIRTHFVFSDFLSENRAVYEIMWKNMVDPDMSKMTI